MTFETYDEFLRHTTAHLLLTPARPVLGVRRWVVDSRSFHTWRPVVVWGTERRARQVAQRLHAAHARARAAVAQDLDADLAGTCLVRREYRLLWSDHDDACETARKVGAWPEAHT